LKNTCSVGIKPKRFSNKTRCPDDEIGKNSVTPWTKPKKIAWNNVICLFYGLSMPPLEKGLQRKTRYMIFRIAFGNESFCIDNLAYSEQDG
jgi:hypothetical protein